MAPFTIAYNCKRHGGVGEGSTSFLGLLHLPLIATYLIMPC